MAVCVAGWSLQEERWKDIQVTGFIAMADWGFGGGDRERLDAVRKN